MLKIRRLHTYLALFFAPLLLFFIATGWYQTVKVDRKKGFAEAESWVDRMTSVHVDQVYPSPTVDAYSPKLFQALVVVMSVALILTALLGVYLGFRVLRPAWLCWLVLALGFAVPILFLFLGQKRGGF